MAEGTTVIAGTKEGAKKALETKRRLHGNDCTRVWGRLGGAARNISPRRQNPFSNDREFARDMGKKSAEIRWGKRKPQEAE